MPLFVQLVQHYSPTGAGEILLPAGVAMTLCFPLAGRLGDRIDARLLLGAGVLMFAGSMWLLSDVAGFTSFSAMAFAVALSRTGIATVMPAANASAMRQAPDMLAAAAPAATFLTQTGGALGVAILSALLQDRAAFHAQTLQPLVNELNGQAVEAMVLLRQALEEILLVTPPELKRHVDAVAQAVVERHGFLSYRAYVAKVGRGRQIELYFIVPAGWPARTLESVFEKI